MTEREKAAARANGALDDFFLEMQEKFAQENRSSEYKQAFWRALKDEMRATIRESN
jgi:hypothetical protein